MRMWRLLAGLLLALTAAPAFAQDKPAPQMSRADARAYFEQYISRGPLVQGCGLMAASARKVDGVTFTETGLTITCQDKVRTVEFASKPLAWISRGMMLGRRFFVCVGDRRVQDVCNTKDLLIFYDMDDPQRFVDAWAGLQRLPPPPPPALDTAFQEALRLVRASAADRTEDQRRAQVQVEALVGAGKTKEAAALLREALKTSPDWPSGHYNLALIAGDLGDLTEAITEMRRYLYLEPAAPDARAAQDQIYKWEALSEGPPQ